jgi:hypothetical protein
MLNFAATVKGMIWDAKPCSLVEVRRRFERMKCPYLQGRRASQEARNQQSFEDGDSAFYRNVADLLPNRQRYTPEDSIRLLSVYCHRILDFKIFSELPFATHIID